MRIRYFVTAAFILAFIGTGAYGWWAGWFNEQISLPQAIEFKFSAAEEANEMVNESAATSTPLGASVPMIIGTTPVLASVADEREERIRGLSGVPYLAPNEVKLFVFAYDEQWSFWMKDMHFAIDMIWVDASSTIVYIEENVSPETFPRSFEPTVPARYVIETVAGFAAEHNIGVGDRVILPEENQ